MDSEVDDCTWMQDSDGNWSTTCGHVHVFVDGTPCQNRYAYCPYCGGRLVQTETEVGSLPVADIITTKADIDLCLGSGELMPCPFCGHWAMSHGEKTKSGRGVMWTISCTHTTHLYPDCCASVWAVDEDQDKARAKAVARWNRRPNAHALAKDRSGDSQQCVVVGGKVE